LPLPALVRQLGAWITSVSEALHPDCFAFVMAAGIISNALFAEAYHTLSGLLLDVNVLSYGWLAILTALRSIRFPHLVWLDLTSPYCVFSFFTLVASNDVLGAGFYLRGVASVPLDLWILALFTWLILIYFSFGVLSFRNGAHQADVIRGGWLLAIVGTESLVTLGALIAHEAGAFSPTIFVLSHMLWGIGIGLYAILIVLIANRIFYFDINPSDITPMLWVVMGAAAISTNAGSELLLAKSGMSSLEAIRPFIEGVTLSTWAWATWWTPLLLLFELWKHGVHRMPLTYTPMLWPMVFPLGMYSLATLRFSLAADFPVLRVAALAMLWIALAAWGVTSLGLVIVSWRSFRNFSRSNVADRA